MNIGVAGLGHVGLVTAACLAEVGHHVVGMDVSTERVQDLRRGKAPFFEPGLDLLIGRGLREGRLRFEERLPPVVEHSDAVFICVGTPSLPNGEADLSQVEGLAVELAGCLDDRYRVLIEKSTVPVTTGGRMFRTIARLTECRCDIVSNPEFLREGSAVHDALNPDRIVIGSASPEATTVMREIYAPVVERSGCVVLETDVATAELIKHASNAFLATKISFINYIAEVCDAVGGDVEIVARGMGLDQRIAPDFLRAGIGYGGSCFPKDVGAFAAIGEQVSGDSALLRAVQDINRRAMRRLIEKVRSELWYLKDKRIGVLGLAFKPGTDDMRDAPSLTIIASLLEEGAEVVAYDPVAMPAAKELLPEQVRFAGDPLEALHDAHAAMILTEWPQFAELDLAEMKNALRLPIVADGRNVFDVGRMRDAGFTYLSMGRPAVEQ